MHANTTLYDQDFYAWTQAQAALLREGAWAELDMSNLAEEVESWGKSQHRELWSRLRTLLMHLLKWGYQPQARSGSWRSTIRDQRDELQRLMADSPSLRQHVDATIADSYPKARVRAHDETGLPLATFPDRCPWTAEQVLDDEFWPEA